LSRRTNLGFAADSFLPGSYFEATILNQMKFFRVSHWLPFALLFLSALVSGAVLVPAGGVG